MGFFDRHKALIITVLLCSLLLLVMYNIKLSNARDELEEMIIDLDHLKVEEPVAEEKEEAENEEQPQQPQQTSTQTHQAFNQNQQQRESSFQSRLNEIFEKNSAEQTASEEENSPTFEGEFRVNKNRSEERRERSDGNNTSEETSAKTGNVRNSSIAFSLVGRSASLIPNPIYTCDTSGKIVVNIVVNEDGNVTDTSINKSSSTSNNECLVDNALEYAAGAVFSKLGGRNAQKGTITYYFQG
ncbi:hypothetical protein GCM10007103_27460 [Salinimicrobium marinum]|uniref:TonB family C-terminal domain-containing protein n=1 Tax=Salinimicrobium marinum TaxID=680283 RepID=A0A918SK53_9FLAO|nr:hypothetical protein [Salinimicrobium marinum]GHA44822.1 hypothetical protein GCM10007103_27460 [Salinimicrobium marinum]